MELLKFVRVYVVILVATAVVGLQIKTREHVEGVELCKKLSQAPYFDVEMVIGKPWRIYYSWNIKLDDKCMDMSFKNVTPMIINRIWNDMNEYLESQPYWDAATLLVNMGRAKHEMLLFADQGSAGRFVGVPNVIRDGNITPTRKTVPLLKFHLKILHGKFLLMADCQIGVTTMSARTSEIPYRAEIGGIAQQMDLGDGHHACVSDMNKNEIRGLE